MTTRLQNFDYRSSTYEQPKQAWVCGRAASGQPCRLGPDGRGRCRTVAECEPRRAGDGWLCTRAESAGGACANGPLADGRCCRSIEPCAPQRSLRSRRGLVTAWATVVSLGMLIWMLGGSMNREMLYPGPVSGGHGEVEDCGNCHVALEGGSTGWLSAAFRPTDADADSRKCLECHEKGNEALYPHNLTKPDLTRVSRAAANSVGETSAPWIFGVSQTLFPLPDEAHGPLACATCHKEHEGEAADLLQVANARCQSCHEVKFESFAQDHPSFGDYPYLRRTRLVFDHESHNRKHFPEKKDESPEACADCHQVDGTGRYMLSGSFAETCAGCHTEDISGASLAGPKGIPVIGVPELDLDTLQERGIDIGSWPDLALVEEISPYTKLLLASETTLAADLQAIEAVDLQDLTAANDVQLESVRRVAWGIKELLFDLAIAGQGNVETRVEASLHRALDTDTLGRLVGNMPKDVVEAAGQAWFPRLKREVVDYRGQKSAALPPHQIRGQAGSDNLSDDQLLAIDDDVIHPDDELLLIDEKGNPIEGAKIDSSQEAAAEQPAAEQPAAEEPAAEEPAQEVAEEPAAETPTEQAATAETATEATEQTAEAEPAATAATEPASGEEQTGQSDAAAVAETEAETPADTPEAEAEVAVVEEETDEDLDLPTLDPEDWAKAGGWYRKDYALFYRPAEHQDGFLRTWLDIGARSFGTPAERYGETLFALLSHKNTPGKCIKCHSVDREAGAGLAINWGPFTPTIGQSKFTMFAHDTHFSALTDDRKGCVTCHHLNEEAKYLEAYEGRDPERFTSNFAPLKQETCANCHVEAAVGDDCVLCHQYHVGDFNTTPMETRMAELSKKAEPSKDGESADGEPANALDAAVAGAGAETPEAPDAAILPELVTEKIVEEQAEPPAAEPAVMPLPPRPPEAETAPADAAQDAKRTLPQAPL